jgi:transposase
VAHEVTNEVGDRELLSPMAAKAKEAIGHDAITVIADRGYFSGEEVLACEALGVSPLVPKPYTSGARADGRFGKQDFVYLPEQDAYRCPAGNKLVRHMTVVEEGQTLHKYWDLASCKACSLKPRCTPSPMRRVTRWEHEGVVDAMLERLELTPDAMTIRRRTVEHVFGTIKSWMGATHFLTKGLDKVRTEMSLQVLAYNLRRLMSILGVRPLIAAIIA